MTARELIEQEFVAHGGNPKVCEAEPHGYDLAAERVIDRLQRRVEELEQENKDIKSWAGGFEIFADQRVKEIKRLNIHIRELEEKVKNWESVGDDLHEAVSDAQKRERYRDRLDQGVFQILGGYGYPARTDVDNVIRCVDDALTLTKLGIAAIDAEVEGRK